jgi:beta-glucanase (GH16 family)
MKKVLASPLFLILFTVLVGYGASSGHEWVLQWSDEFDQDGLPDPKIWDYDVGGHGWGNKELQFYTRDRLENARVEDGRLIITARREPWEGKEYTSSRLVTRSKKPMQFGRLEIRAKLPAGVGTWPAIWMMPENRSRENPWPVCGEIDIMEHVGFDPGMVHSTTHTRDRNWMNGRRLRGTIEVPDFSEEFHTYAMEWTPQAIKTFVDGEPFYTYPNEGLGKSTWPFDTPFYLILNIAVGGGWGGREGVDEHIWPQTLEVEYVRYYQRAKRK